MGDIRQEVLLSLGRTLKETRIKRGISLSDVSRELLIQEEYLEAIEDDVEGVIPTGTYKRIYTRAYCKFLGIEFREDVKPPVVPKMDDVRIEKSKVPAKEATGVKARIIEKRISTNSPTDLEFTIDYNKIFRVTLKTLIIVFVIFLIVKFFQWIF